MARTLSERSNRVFLERVAYLFSMPGTGNPPRIARAFRDIRSAFRGYVVPMRGKAFDWKMSLPQRGTKAWKNHPNSYYNNPTTPDEVIDWAWTGVSGIAGIVGERSGLMVLEIDCLEPFLSLLELLNLPLFRTPTATSPSGGYHLYFQYREGLQKSFISIKCPVFNDPDSPCYAGRLELGSLRVNGVLVLVPPGRGRQWELGFSMVRNDLEKEIEAVEMPDVLFEFFKRLEERPFQYPSKELQPELKLSPDTQEQQDPCSSGIDVLVEKDSTVLVEPSSEREFSPSVLDLYRKEDSPLIRALIRTQGGHGLRVSCFYHQPDKNPSGSFWFAKTPKSGWYYTDHHDDRTIPISQLCCDLQTGFIERRRSGTDNHFQYRTYGVSRDGKFNVHVPESFLWIVLTAADLDVITLPTGRVPVELPGFTPDGECIMRFIDRWDRSRRMLMRDSDAFPLARRWLISVLFALPQVPHDEQRSEWDRAFNEIDRALYRAKKQAILEKVQSGISGQGGKPAWYRVCDQGGDSI